MHEGLNRLPVAGPSITEREIALVTEAARTAWYGNANVFHDRFERDFAAWVGRAHALALPSCTSAIHLALAALDVRPGDEVIVPESTWIATAAPIDYVGATPVFVDVDEATWCLCPEATARAITPRTRAILAVDLYGGTPDLPALEALADAHDVALIEDAAEAIGATRDGRRAGAFGRAGVFSFHGSKTLTTGEGGMLVTDDADLDARCRFLRDHGRVPGDTRFCNAEVAYKYRMSALQAALGCAQLERVDELVAGKRAIFEAYRDRLADVPGVTLNPEPPNTTNAFWMTTVVCDESIGMATDELQAALLEHGVDTRPFFRPLSSLPAYAGRDGIEDAARRNAVACRLARCGVNLPSALCLDEQDVDRACGALTSIVRGRSGPAVVSSSHRPIIQSSH
jgi:perosamine synthetase